MHELHERGGLAGRSQEARRFAAFCFVEEALLSTLLCFAYARYSDRVEPWQVMAAVLGFLVAASATNAAIYFGNEGLSWRKLRLWEKTAQVLVAVSTAFIAFLVAFAILGLFPAFVMSPLSLMRLSGMAGFSLGLIGLFGFQLSRDGEIEGFGDTCKILAKSISEGSLSGASEFGEPCPDCPFGFGAAADIRDVIAEHPELPIVVFVELEGADGVYCGVDRAEVVKLPNCKTPYCDAANAGTGREPGTIDGDRIQAIAIYARWKGC